MIDLLPGTNTGVIDASPPPKGWIAGAETGAAPEILEQSGDYSSYLPEEESQATFIPFTFDTYACVTFSGTNLIECIVNRMLALNIMPSSHRTFLYDSGYINKQSGKINISDRFTAKMSGTTSSGNSLGNVAESIRYLHGVLPESDWPTPTFSTSDSVEQRWNKYYEQIPQELQNKAKKFLDYFEITYQWVVNAGNANVKDFLKYGPVQIASSVCSPWGSTEGMPPIPACGCSTQHATIIYGQNNGAYKDFDSYKSFKKLLASDYCIPYAVQYYVKPKQIQQAPVFNYVFVDPQDRLSYGAQDSQKTRNLQKALQSLKRSDGSAYMKSGVFGPFGPQTRSSLALFQVDKGISSTDGGNNFGPKTIRAMNAALSIIS